MSLTVVPAEMPAKRNRHPVDELADVRAEIKQLSEREQKLRTEIIVGDCSLEGNEFSASVIRSQSTKLDTKAIRKEFGTERLSQFMKNVEITRVLVSKVGELPNENED